MTNTTTYAQHASSRFELGAQDETPVAWDGAEVSRGRWTKTFTGDLTGTSYLEATFCRPEQGAPVYVAIERIEGELAGRRGSFLLVHVAVADEADGLALWQVVPGSGTDGLAGLRGRGEITPDHEFRLAYDL